MDEIDLGNQHAELFREIALNEARKVNQEPALYIDGQKCCVDCEEPIPAKRLIANPDAVRCVGCQSEKEKTT